MPRLSYGTSGGVCGLCHGCGKPEHKVKDCPTTKTPGIVLEMEAQGVEGQKEERRTLNSTTVMRKDTIHHIALIMLCSAGKSSWTNAHF